MIWGVSNLFQTGEFTLSSGRKSRLKIECDALSPEDWATLAWMVHHMVGPFSSVEGVPTGGLALEDNLRKYQSSVLTNPHLIVDDVWTTGASMEKCKERAMKFIKPGREIIGAVVFVRGLINNDWVKGLLPLPECFHNM